MTAIPKYSGHLLTKINQLLSAPQNADDVVDLLT